MEKILSAPAVPIPKQRCWLVEHSARGGGVAAAVASPLGVGRAHSPPGNEVRKYVPQAVEQQAIRCLRAEHRPRSDAATWGAVDLDRHAQRHPHLHVGVHAYEQAAEWQGRVEEDEGDGDGFQMGRIVFEKRGPAERLPAVA